MDTWIEGYVRVGPLTLHYYRCDGDGPPLVLAHGVGDSARCWGRLPADLAAEGYAVVAYDARGHGRSDAPAGGYDLTTLATDLAGLVEALGLDRPVLVGHSLGASTAALLAATRPGLLRCLILEDPGWRVPGAEPTPEERARQAAGWRGAIKRWHTQTPEEIALAWLERSPQARLWPEAELAPWAAAKRELSPHLVGIFTAPGVAYTDIVPAIACPTLLLTGEPSAGAVVTAEAARDAARRNPLIELATVGGAGHAIRRERYDEYWAAAGAFLRRHLGGAPPPTSPAA